MFIYLNKKAQSTAEYVIILGLVIGAVIAMQTYVKRNLNSRVKEAADFTHEPAEGTQVGFTGEQYEPYYLSSDFNTTRNSESTEDVSADGGAVEKQVIAEHTNRAGTQQIGAVE